MPNLIMGPSNGWLLKQGISNPNEQERVLEETGSNAIELCLGGGFEGISASLRAPGASWPNILHLSVHLRDCPRRPLSESDWIQLAVPLQRFSCAHGVANVVVHPLKTAGGEYPEGRYEAMTLAGLRLAIENMDPGQAGGFDINELVKLSERFGLKVVLDLQHAHEHGMDYARELFSALKSCVTHLHVSGKCGENIHALVCEATNAKQIIELLGWVLQQKIVPIILEGKYKNSGQLLEEMKFLQEELG